MLFIYICAILFSYSLGNRLIGSPEWKEVIPFGRVLAFSLCPLIAVSGTYLINPEQPPWLYGATYLFLVMSFILCRQRSPRGAFFLRTGGRLGLYDAQVKRYTYLFDGKHNKVSAWLATIFTGVNFQKDIIDLIKDQDVSDEYKQNRESAAKKYSMGYAIVHHTWALLLLSILPAIVLQSVVIPVGALLCGLSYPVCNIAAGVDGGFDTEKGSGHRAELASGVCVHGMFAVYVMWGISHSLLFIN